jgi:hypothetical protein
MSEIETTYFSNDNFIQLKRKLTNVCKATKFCGVCLDNEEKLWSVDTEFDIAVGEQTHKKLLKDIIDYILNDVVRIFQLCIKSLILY